MTASIEMSEITKSSIAGRAIKFQVVATAAHKKIPDAHGAIKNPGGKAFSGMTFNEILPPPT